MHSSRVKLWELVQYSYKAEWRLFTSVWWLILATIFACGLAVWFFRRKQIK